MFVMYRKVSRYTTPEGPLSLSQDYAGSMLQVPQLKLPSRSYRAIGGIAILSQIAVQNATKERIVFHPWWNVWGSFREIF